MMWSAGASGQALEGFRTPSDNIHCQLQDGVSADPGSAILRCDISKIDRMPPRPRSCDLEWGTSFAISVNGQTGERLCAGDTTSDPSLRILGYGEYWQAKGFTCRAEQSGLTCFNSLRHGFTLSRASQRLF